VLPRPGTVAADDDLVIDLDEALDAPLVDEDPVEAGMLLAQLSLFSTDPDYTAIRPGQPYLMTSTGEWRQFDLATYGFTSEPYGELSLAISSDGRKVAFADPSGLVVVTLDGNTFDRFELPVDHEVALMWSPDGSTLLFKDRHSRKPCGKGCTLDVSTGHLSPVPYDVFYSAYGNEGAVFELEPADQQPGAARLRTYQGAVLAGETPMEYRFVPSTAGGPAAARDVAFAQCDHPGGAEAPGVMVVDADSGRLISWLTKPAWKSCRLGALAWLTDDRLVVDDWMSGAVWLWDVARGQVRQIAVGVTSGVHLHVAEDVMTNRLNG
jgi:hypothetical protein